MGRELAHKFKLDESTAMDLAKQLKHRKATEYDLKVLWEVWESSRQPALLLRLKICQMKETALEMQSDVVDTRDTEVQFDNVERDKERSTDQDSEEFCSASALACV